MRNYLLLTILVGTTISAKKTDEDKKINPSDFEKVTYDWTRTWAQVMQYASEKHYNTAYTEQAMINAINCFLNTLDPHSNFLDPKTYKSMIESTSGEFFGVGIVIDNTRKQKDKFLTIVDTIPDGPADKSGVKPLDKIMEIDGSPLEGMSTEEATAKLKGQRNTQVHVKILRDKQQDLLPFDIVRDVVKEQNSLSFFIQDQNIAYLSLNMFTENAVKQIEELLNKANKQKYKALILDLRNNSGGLLSAAIDIAGLFLPKGSLVVTTKDKNNKLIAEYNTNRNPIAKGSVPIFILINNYTASAAEILAGCLKMHSESLSGDRGLKVFLVGTKTFGKGSVQEVIPVGNNSAIKITTSLYYLPNDTTIQGVGIEPDFLVERSFPPTEQMQWFTKFYGREQTLSNYIQAHKVEEQAAEAAKKEPSRWSERAKEMLQTDNQLRDTISLANLLSTFHEICPAKVCDRAHAITFLKQNHLTNDTLDIQEIKL